MKNDEEKHGEREALRNLPHYSALKGYPETQWLCFGTLTHKHRTQGSVQIARFKDLMDRIGLLNASYGKRLHWIVRAEGQNGGIGDTENEQKRTHLHFLLGRHKVENGHKSAISAQEASAFLERHWSYGKAEVEAFKVGVGGLEYVLKCPNGPTSEDWEDIVEISPALIHLLTEEKKRAEYVGREPWLLEVVAELRRRGANIWFGDEVPHWRRV